MITVFQACSSGNTNAILRNIRYLQSNGFGTLLHTACLGGHVDMIRLLVSSGAPVDTIDEDVLRPMHRACQSGSLGTIHALLELGADEKDIDIDIGVTLLQNPRDPPRLPS